MGYSRNRNTSQKRKIARLNIADQNDKIEACERLSRDYNLSKVELLLQYDKFKRDNENGVITKERFLSEEKNNIFAGCLFNVFDEDNSGTLNFYEFMCIKYSKTSTKKDKLEWIFKIFDTDGSGTINMEELSLTIEALHRMSGEEQDEENVIRCTMEILDTIDTDGDGEITKEEFIENALKNKFISDLFSNI